MTDKRAGFAEVIKNQRAYNSLLSLAGAGIVGFSSWASVHEKNWVFAAGGTALAGAAGFLVLNIRKDLTKFTDYFNAVRQNDGISTEEAAKLSKELFILLSNNLETFYHPEGGSYQDFPDVAISQFNGRLDFLDAKEKLRFADVSRKLVKAVPYSLRHEIISDLKGDTITWPEQFTIAVREGVEQARGNEPAVYAR